MACNLRDLMTPFVLGEQDEAGFTVSMQFKATSLAVSPFGEELLHVIGYVYKLAGEKALGRQEVLGLKGHLLSLQQKGHIVSNQAQVLGAGAKAWWSQRAAAQEQAKRDEMVKLKKSQIMGQNDMRSSQAQSQTTTGITSPVELSEAEKVVVQEAEAAAEAIAIAEVEAELGVNGKSSGASQANFMVQMLEALWHISVLDIESTLRNATHKLLHDKSVSPDVITKRAQALFIAGKVFLTTEFVEPIVDGDVSEGAVPDKKRKKKTWRDHLHEQVNSKTGPPPDEPTEEGEAY